MAPGTSQDTSSPSSGLHGGHHLMIQGTYLDADFRLVRGHLGTVFSCFFGGIQWDSNCLGAGGVGNSEAEFGFKASKCWFSRFFGGFVTVGWSLVFRAAVCRKCWLLNSISWAVLFFSTYFPACFGILGTLPQQKALGWQGTVSTGRGTVSTAQRGTPITGSEMVSTSFSVVPRSFEQGDRRRNGNTQNDRLKKNSWIQWLSLWYPKDFPILPYEYPILIEGSQGSRNHLNMAGTLLRRWTAWRSCEKNFADQRLDVSVGWAWPPYYLQSGWAPDVCWCSPPDAWRTTKTQSSWIRKHGTRHHILIFLWFVIIMLSI